MIQIKEVEIENFRSIFKEKIELEFGDLTSIVGPNNSGKSNILRALQLFFTGMVEGKQYSSAHDFPLCEEVSAKDSTKIIVTVKYEPTKEHLLHNALLELQNTTTQKMLDDDLVKLRLSYSKNGVESWGFIGKSGNKNIQKDVIYKVRDALRQAIEFRYIPVGRNSLENITHEISSELIKTIFSGFSGAVKKRQDINTAINDLINKLSPSLSQSSLDVSQAVKQVFEEVQNVELHLPFSNLEEMIPNLSLVVSDTAKTGLQFKGAGIQTSTLLFLLKYLADKKPKHYNATQTSIWAIEEPESFLHPTKQKAISGLLKEFAKDVQTIITTHCAHFVPRDLERSSKVLVVDKLGDQFKSTQVVGTTYQEARQALGVSILDAMLLYPVNLIVEGISDEILIKGALSCLAQELGLNINDIKIFAANNALSATYLFETFSLNIEQNSNIVVQLILDGDDAGRKALKNLENRPKEKKISLRSNIDYFQLPNTIEDLLSDRVKRLLKKTMPSQVSLNEDINGRITHFSFEERHKKRVAEKAVDLSERREDWDGFKGLLTKILESW